MQTHSLGVGRRAVVSLHGVQQVVLGLVGKIGQLHAHGEGDLPLVHHGKQLRTQIGQPDIAEHLIPALVGGRANFRRRVQPCRNLRRSEIRAPSLPFQGLHFELVGKGLLRGQHSFPVEVAVHHKHRSLVPADGIDKGGNLFDSRQPCGVGTPVPGNDFISAGIILCRSDDQRIQDAVFPDALDQGLHVRIVLYLVGMPFKGHQVFR